MALSEDLKELYASGGSSVILDTLSFSHATWDNEFRIVRDWSNLTANLEDSGPEVTFNKFAFNIQGPSKDDNGNQYLKITVDSVSREFVELLETAVLDTNNTPIEVVYRQYLDTDTTGPQNDPPLKLFMKNVRVTNTSVSGNAQLVSLVNRKFPNVVYGSTFQSLVYRS